MFNLIIKGKVIKKAKEGITNQKIPVDSWLIFFTSFVSKYNQMIAKTETNGKDAINDAINELLFEISEITTIKNDETNSFKI